MIDCKNVTRKFLRCLSISAAILTVLGATVSSVSAQTILTGFLYVSDYSRSDLDRYQFSYNAATGARTTGFTPYGYGGNTSDATFITGGIKEGLQGTANDIIVVGTNGAILTRYDLNGNKIGDITISGYPSGVTALQGIGNVAITSDGKFMYAPDETAGYIYKINLITGHIDNFVAFTGVHDVAIGSDGTVYAAGYTTTTGVNIYSANLSLYKNLIPNATMIKPTGISLTTDTNGNTTGAYIMSQNTSGSNGPDSVYKYSFTGTGSGEIETLISNNAFANLRFSFGNAIGPDGNVYSAELGAVFGTNTGYTGGVYMFNTTALTSTSVINGSTYGSPNTYGLGNLGAPKYLQFSTNFIKVGDAGVPEPGNVAMLVGMGLAGTFILRKRKK